MGLYDVIFSVCDGINSLLTGSKLPEHWSDGETRNQIVNFTTTLANNTGTGKYPVYEGFKHVPGVTEQEMRKDGGA